MALWRWKFVYFPNFLFHLSLTLVSSNRILSNYQYFNHETNTLRTTPSFDIPNLDQL